jgi:hypothetical protein
VTALIGKVIILTGNPFLPIGPGGPYALGSIKKRIKNKKKTIQMEKT